MPDHEVKRTVFHKFNQHQNNQRFQIHRDILIDFMQIYIAVFKKQMDKFPQSQLDSVKIKQHINRNNNGKQNVGHHVQHRIHQSRQAGNKLRHPVIIGLQHIYNVIGDAVYQREVLHISQCLDFVGYPYNTVNHACHKFIDFIIQHRHQHNQHDN